MSLGVGECIPVLEGCVLQFHGDRSSCVWDPSRLFPMYLFIWLLLCILIITFIINWQMEVNVSLSSSKLVKPRGELLKPTIYSQWVRSSGNNLELPGCVSQMGASRGTEPLRLWGLTLSLGRLCRNFIKSAGHPVSVCWGLVSCLVVLAFDRWAMKASLTRQHFSRDPEKMRE